MTSGDRADLAEFGHNTDRSLHAICEVLKRASADRALWRNSGEAEDLLINKAYGASRAAEIGEGATPSATQAGGFTVGTPEEAGDPLEYIRKYGSTTHFDVVDGSGNALSCT